MSVLGLTLKSPDSFHFHSEKAGNPTAKKLRLGRWIIRHHTKREVAGRSTEAPSA